MNDRIPNTDSDDAEQERRDRYADELAEQREQERASHFRVRDYADRTGAHRRG